MGSLRLPLLLAALLLAPPVASAQSIYNSPGAHFDADAPQPAELRYRHKLALADGVAGGLLLGSYILRPSCASSRPEFGIRWPGPSDALCRTSTGLLVGFVGSYALAPSVAHLSEGQVGSAAASFGLRVGLPVALGYAFTGFDEPAFGVVAGMGAAVLIDWLVLAKKKNPKARPASVSPTVSPTQGGGAALGLVGSF